MGAGCCRALFGVRIGCMFFSEKIDVKITAKRSMAMKRRTYKRDMFRGRVKRDVDRIHLSVCWCRKHTK